MGGFVGFTGAKQLADPKNTLDNMLATIIHRGPDNKAEFLGGDMALGVRQINMGRTNSREGDPIYNEDKTCVLVFDGNLYNYSQLREELIGKGHEFKGGLDREVIIHGYEEYGVGILQKIRGMFAFALWDMEEDLLFLARDNFGIKPLYYTQNTRNNSLIFGSEIKSFLQSPVFRKEFNSRALKPYLTFQYSVLDETFFKGVYKLRPAHYILYKQNKMVIKPYWSPQFDEGDNSMDYYVNEIENIIEDSVKAHRGMDDDVASFLSGGVDSSYITALLRPKKSFSIGFKDYEGIFDETNHARDLSKLLGIENIRKNITAEECFETLPKIQYHMDEPQSNPSSVPLYFLCQLASKHAKTILSGEGADEIFGGYEWYHPTARMAKYELIPFFIRRYISQVSKILPKNKITNFLKRGGQRPEENFIGQAKIFWEDEAEKILKDQYKGGPSLSEITGQFYQQVQDRDDVTRMQYLDLNLWLPGDILLKADKMGAAHSIVIKLPFLDKFVMAVASQIPSKYRVNNKQTKISLRAAAKGVLPKEWAERPKIGFPVPIRYWLREEKYYRLVKQIFESDMAEKFFNIEELMNYLECHYNNKGNYARNIWTVYVFLIWYKKFFIEL